MIAINTEIPKKLKRAIKMIAVKKDTTFKAVVIEALEKMAEKEGIKHE